MEQGRVTFNVVNGFLTFKVESNKVFGDFLGTFLDPSPNIFDPETVYSLINPDITATDLSAKIHPLSNDFRSFTFELETDSDSELCLSITKVLSHQTAPNIHPSERETIEPYFYTLRLP